MNNDEIDNIAKHIKSNKVWKQNFKDLHDVLENGLMKIDVIPQSHTAIVNLNLTSDFILQQVNKFLKQFDLSIPQKNVLEALYYSSCELTQAQLSKFVYSSKSNISSIIERMEKKGLIKRYENPQNKRVKLVSITKTGEEKLKELFYCHLRGHLQNLITEDEAKELNRILFKLRKNFTEVYLK